LPDPDRKPVRRSFAQGFIDAAGAEPCPRTLKTVLSGEPPFDTSGRQPIGQRTTSRAMWMEVRLTQARESAATRSQPDIGAPNAIRQADYERLQAQHARCSTTRQVAVVHGKGPRRRRPTTRPRADGDRDIGPEINESVDYRCQSAAGGRRPVAAGSINAEPHCFLRGVRAEGEPAFKSCGPEPQERPEG
jgi:hypothetical protein